MVSSTQTGSKEFRNQSFQGQDLTREDFSNASIRGCDFSYADLTGVDFSGAKIDSNPWELEIAIPFGISLLVSALIAGTIYYTIAGAIPGFLAHAVVLALVMAAAILLKLTKVIVAELVAFGIVIFGVLLFAALTVLFLSKSYLLATAICGLFFLASVALVFYLYQEVWDAIEQATASSFEYAILTEANFQNATIKNTNFLNAHLDWVDWQGAEISDCRFSQDERAIKLCADRTIDREDSNYSHMDLSRLNLSGAVLEGANLRKANLYKTNLQQARLKKADLSGTSALSTDFSYADLTGASIGNWGINAETNFTEVECDYIYWGENFTLRKPEHGGFIAGDLTNLIGHFEQTLDLFFRDRINPQAFDGAFNALVDEYPTLTVSLRSVEKTANGPTIVRLLLSNLPEGDLDYYEHLHDRFFQAYKAYQEQQSHYRQDLQQTIQQIQQVLAELEPKNQASKHLESFIQPTAEAPRDRAGAASLAEANQGVTTKIQAPCPEATATTGNGAFPNGALVESEEDAIAEARRNREQIIVLNFPYGLENQAFDYAFDEITRKYESIYIRSVGRATQSAVVISLRTRDLELDIEAVKAEFFEYYQFEQSQLEYKRDQSRAEIAQLEKDLQGGEKPVSKVLQSLFDGVHPPSSL